MHSLESWGRYPKLEQSGRPVSWRHEALPELEGSMLPHGLGRSYGDSCLNQGGNLLVTTGLDRLIDFDEERGLLTCEAGVSLAQVIDFSLPRGWFLPVSPGTRYVTVGGAVANDVHGKNHHRAGTFGCHVTRLELLRSDGSRRVCSEQENPEWFAASVGGLGLTGLITWVEFQLLRVANPCIETEQIKFHTFTEFDSLVRESDSQFAYTVAWVDTAARGQKLGRGIFIRGNHASPDFNQRKHKASDPQITIPLEAPDFLLNPWSMKLFNWGFYHKQRPKTKRVVSYQPFFYPLDGIAHWNRLYGGRGFVQHQCIVPDVAAVSEILERVGHHGQCSFLTVLKAFGSIPSPGMMSFPREGLTLTMDFGVTPALLAMLDELDEIVVRVGGSLYPAKDARMSAAHFQTFFPNWRSFCDYVDPAFSSEFWRRVTKEGDQS